MRVGDLEPALELRRDEREREGVRSLLCLIAGGSLSLSLRMRDERKEALGGEVTGTSGGVGVRVGGEGLCVAGEGWLGMWWLRKRLRSWRGPCFEEPGDGRAEKLDLRGAKGRREGRRWWGSSGADM